MRWPLATAVLAVGALVMGVCSGPAPAEPVEPVIASCREPTDSLLRSAQEDLSDIELWSPEDQAALFADPAAMARRADLVYVHSIFARLGDRNCGAVALQAAWCERIHDLVAGSEVGRVVRAWMIQTACGT